MSVQHLPKKQHGAPWLLSGETYTPATRTPWGGRYIVETLRPDAQVAGVVGEAWEFSVEPDFPSRLRDGGLLSDRIKAAPAAALGDAYPERTNTALLVKLLDAKDNLSVQIHPSDDYAGLGPGESGKPESWYVLAHTEGAGLYIGLSEEATRDDIQAALESGADLRPMMHFVPVQVGDFFVIDAGTLHAVGAGCTLVEPQRVVPGSRGLTYRYWDWGRRYDDAGRLDANGQPRALHVRDALAVTDWDGPRADALLERIRLRTGAPQLDHAAHVTPLAGPGGLAFDALRVSRLAGTGALKLDDWRRIRALTVLEGDIAFEDGTTLGTGESAALPASLGGATVELNAASAILSAAL